MSAAPESIAPINPATGEPLAPVPCTAREDVPAIVARARAAQAAWASAPLEVRARHVRDFAAALLRALDSGQVAGERMPVAAKVRLGGLTPDDVSVEAVYGRPEDGTDPAPVNIAQIMVSLRPEEEWTTGRTRAPSHSPRSPQ